jgi:hypothetical protein
MDFHRVYLEDAGIRMGRVAGGSAFDCWVLWWTSEDGEEGTA